jgi:choice-of-anchor A domain-containing protein
MRQFMSVVSTVALSAAVLGPVAAHADTASDYNLFVLGNANVHSSDTQGRVAVGGNATFDSYSIGTNASPSSVNLVVGGKLTAGVNGGGSTVGLTEVGGTASFHGWSNAGVTTGVNPLPVDFASEATRLDTLTTTLSQYAATGTVGTVPWGGQFTLDAANSGVSGLNVFDISGAQLASSNTFTIDVAAGQTVLINVDGSADQMSGGLNILGGSASQILWNFYDASTLSFSGIAMEGSVLAPTADYQGGWGQLNGELIVDSFEDTKGATQINSGENFVGNLLDPPSQPTPPLTTGVPEPAAWMMMILGFGLAGGMLRHRRRVLAV